ncbi:hypothetical protein EJ05DRAFT_474178 [Pseudovirgaria hyperparasitica]|uniref:RSC complex subunit Rsc9 n=1 Tax=Pseudovirgaria hyperparasitica TaxID=470096 RepID=A0A6A6WDN2_9PEZI|nr:uncharacterized protein EJ05DRAFT_474178 [Pseudovirgaria hyperparasitica]KAF2760289.1 hypothetical protein EJ05DRAFT_474178 [Pseudovirgaria hyperparasitica]
MAPARPREPSIDRSEEYEEFMTKLAAYHEKRGTTLEREPKIANRHIDLNKLYKRVCEEGGYDRVSDTKGNKLAWRKLAAEFLPGVSSLITQAFLVKTAYYKNLAAYEITNFHGKEPPPKEILEDLTAKGGDLMNRTVENYFASSNREADMLTNGQDSDDSDQEDKTPKEEKMDIDEPGSTGARVTRGLRHAPPQRVLFQPDAGRQTRNSGIMNSPTPSNLAGGTHVNGLNSGNAGAAMTIAGYEPQQPAPSQVKPVVTPSNNPEHFRNLAVRNRHRSSRKGPAAGMMAPGTGFIGPNIYIRALLALQSGLVEEEAYALHHLVKISHERGDKYQFTGFPGLAEALMTKVLEVSSVFYNVKWDISYTGVGSEPAHVLDGLSGTSNLLGRIRSLERLNVGDDIQDADFIIALGRVNEAGLVLRNMVMLEENAHYVSQIPLIRDLITIVLNLPNHPSVRELQHYALDIAEQVTKYWSLDSHDPVYVTLLRQAESTDRGSIITSLRALSRISLNLEVKNRLGNVPAKLLQSICDWLLVDDEDLRNACLDFLYQFTAILENVEQLVHAVNIETLVYQLSRLLMYNATLTESKNGAKNKSQSVQAAESAPKLSQAIIDRLVVLDEPERSSQWLKTCYEEDPSGEITQIDLWRAYNDAFLNALSRQEHQKSLMQAKEFITNVSTTFTGAQAQVVTSGQGAKYTIRGIRPRAVPVSPRSQRPYIRCQWHTSSHDITDPSSSECSEYTSQPKDMYEHILAAHLNIPRDTITGEWSLEIKPEVNGGGTPLETRYNCHWARCRHFAATNGNTDARQVGKHIRTHLPDDSAKSVIRNKYNRTEKLAEPQAPVPGGPTPAHTQAVPWPVKWSVTATDERSDAAGLPLASVLVMRNLARQMAKIKYTDRGRQGTPGGRKRYREDDDDEGEPQKGGWVQKAFYPIMDHIFYVMANNLILKDYMTSLWQAVVTGGGAGIIQPTQPEQHS